MFGLDLFNCFSYFSVSRHFLYDVQADCTQANPNLLNEYVKETLAIVNTAILTLDNIGNNEIWGEHLTTYFGTKRLNDDQRFERSM